MPSTYQALPVDGYVQDANRDGVFESVYTGTQSVQVSLMPNLTPAAQIGEERGLMEFNLSGLPAGVPIYAVKLIGEIGMKQYDNTANGDWATIYGYSGDGSLTLGDATAAATQVGSLANPSLGYFSAPINTAFVQSLQDTGAWVGLRLQLTLGDRLFIDSTENPYATPKPTLQIIYNADTDQAPVANNNSYSVNEGNSINVIAPGVVLNDTDPDGDPLSAILVTGTSHGTLTLLGDGSFAYKPVSGFFGTDSFTYKANDGVLDSNVATVTLTVNQVNQPPVAGADAYNVNENTTLTIQQPGVLVNDRDPEGSALTASLYTGASHGAVSLNANGSFSYTPAANYVGSDSFTYRAYDGSLYSSPTTVTLTVNAFHRPPIANNDSYTLAWNTSIHLPPPGVLANDVDPDGNPMTATVVSTTGHGQLFLSSNGEFTYTPNANFYGTDSFIYRAVDAYASSANAVVTFTVNRVNRAPVAVNDSYAVNEDTSLTVTTAATTTSLIMHSQPGDYIGQGKDYAYSPLTGTFGVTRNYDNGVSFSYTDRLDPSYQWWYVDFAAPNNATLVPGTYTGAVRFPFQGPTQPGLDISGEGRGSNTLTGQFTVLQALYDPAGKVLAFDATFEQHSEGATPALTGEIKYNAGPPSGVLANDTDADGDTLTARLISGPANGSLTLSSNGTFTYRPAPNFFGTDSFTYAANDGTVTGNTATATITVNPINDPPSFTKGPDVTVNENPGSVSIPNWATNISAGPPNEATQAVSFLVSTNNPNIFYIQPAISSDGTLTFQPLPGSVGTATITVRAKDSGGTMLGAALDTSPPQTFTITVLNVNPTVTGPADQSASEATEGFFALGTFADPGLDNPWTIDVDWGDGSAHTVFYESTPGLVFSQYHTFATPGNYTVYVTAIDSHQGFGSASFHINVADVAPTLTSAGDQAATEGTGQAFPLGAFTDPGNGPWSVSVDWGDGTAATSFSVTAAGPLPATAHTFALPGSYTVTATVSDPYNGSGSATFTVLVANAPPTVTAPANQSSNEGGSASFDLGSFDDLGNDSPWSVTVSWGDGSSDTFIAASRGALGSRAHTYADNSTYAASVAVTDSGGLTGGGSFSVTVANVAPTVAISGPATGARGQSRTFNFTASDASAIDQAAGFTYRVNWGDGSAVQTIAGSGAGLSHVYTVAGTYTVQATATDKDGGTSAAVSSAITVKAVDLQAGMLAVGGTTAGDTINIAVLDTAGNLGVTINGVNQGTFAPPSQIQIYGQAGDDNIKLSSVKIRGTVYRVTSPALVFGDDGRDTLDARGSSGNNVLVGGAGNDTLYGGTGGDWLIGGLGVDLLHAGNGDDVLVGDSTDFDANLAALNAIMAEWGRTDATYQTRIAHLNGSNAGGLNGGYFLNAATIHDDLAIDQLYGDSGMNWFLYRLNSSAKDKVNDLRSGEVATGL